MLRIVETLSDPGNPDKANEDAFGYAGSHAWVIDGATDVADGPLIGEETGAHWLAREASALFAENAGRYGPDLHGLVRFTIETLARRFAEERLRPPNGRHEWPSAAMALLHAGEGKLACANFADCGSDGFGSIVFDYHRMDPATLVRRAAIGGLRSIADEVRRVEAMEDPDCLEHPRFKRHDDATAVLFRVE